MNSSSRAWAPYDEDSAHKLLCGNRERYIAQSAATKDGVVPDINVLCAQKPIKNHLGEKPCITLEI